MTAICSGEAARSNDEPMAAGRAVPDVAKGVYRNPVAFISGEDRVDLVRPQAVDPEDDCGDPLVQKREGPLAFGCMQIGMAVHVPEARGHEKTAHVDGFARLDSR
ncbi:MAG TPA: hypothetical protein VJH87_12885, partial [Vicinamibacteria bacterium]|nr:hypothetical protein [Vicinamibacteria bacterium]